MSRTDLDEATIAHSLRSMAGDGSVEWCYEPMQTSVLLDVADMLDEVERLRSVVSDGADNARELRAENVKLRELARGLGQCAQGVSCEDCLLYDLSEPDHCREERLSRELGIEVTE